jgi:hypothetical protein
MILIVTMQQQLAMIEKKLEKVIPFIQVNYFFQNCTMTMQMFCFSIL